MSSCALCKHFKRVSTILTDPGICRRYPPTHHAIPLMNNGQPQLQQHCFFPLIMADNWCGEFSAKVSLVGGNDGDSGPKKPLTLMPGGVE